MDLDALAPVPKLSDGLARRPIPLAVAEERLPVPRNPAEVLALLMDFSGSVALAEVLQEVAPAGHSHPRPVTAARALKLRDSVRAQLELMRVRSLRPLHGPRAPSTPTPAELLQAIVGVTNDPARPPCPPEGPAVLRLARTLGAPLYAAFGASLRQTESQFATLRLDIAHELQALGPRAARLERIDAALQRSIQAKVSELFERMELAAEASFERACAQACAALPLGFDADALASWAADGGLIARYKDRSEALTRALFAHLQRGLEGLLTAAIEAEAS
jgi:hypothetical protein